MLTLKTLSFQNIGRFLESQTIDFTSLGSLIQIDAKNNNTDGSSGSGKSTILKALDFLFGLPGCPPKSILQSRLTKDHISVSGIFDWDGKTVVIERSKKLAITIDGELTTGSSDLSEEKLDEIIGMSRDLFRKIIHKRQKEGGFFLELGPAEIHKFMTKCLGLDKELSKVSKVETALSDLEKNKLTAETDLSSNKAALEATQSSLTSLGVSPVQEVTEELLQALRLECISLSDKRKDLEVQLKKEMEELEKTRPIFTHTPFDRSKIVSLEQLIAEIDAKILSHERLEQNRQSEVKAQISELQVKINQLNSAEITRQSEVKSKIAPLQAEITKLQTNEFNRQNEARSQISKLQMDSLRLDSQVSAAVRAKEEAVVLAKELQKVRSAICPTCEQSWVNDTAKKKEADILSKLSEHKKTILAGTEASNLIADLNSKIETLKLESQSKPIPEVDLINSKIANLKLEAEPRAVQEATELSYKIEHLRQEAQPTISLEIVQLNEQKLIHSQMLGLERKAESDHQFTENNKKQLLLVEFNQKQTELREKHQKITGVAVENENKAKSNLQLAESKALSFHEAKKRFDDSHTKLTAQMQKYKDSVSSSQARLDNIIEEIEIVTELKQAIKSYLSCSFDDALESISDEATRIIRSIPNMATASIQLEGLKETQKGTVKEEVNAVISMDGEIGIPLKSLSGGERTSTDLAIDLAVIKFIQERTGIGFNLICFDEPWDGLDTATIEGVVELIKCDNMNKQVVVIGHNPIVNESFENKITVIRDGLTSRIA